MKRGDVVIAATGSGYGGKPRPYVIIQSDDYRTASAVLVGCTSSDDSNVEIRPRLAPSRSNGLAEPSDVMIDIPVTMRRDRIHRVIGSLSAGEMTAIDTALLLFFGLAEGS